ncbi:hypothetical protein RJP21_20890 [Paenibacillus sp. VCA1]|uniref:hypothetical protein n=1 Tax=Paenibacillus sp. VCA1 TaxID=3039148 RepID=UPI0028717BC1|nr:hypothetical protein [Paenibacillus sp. VCA1]MDR9856068.1 hypothetical protein [Paenibacillus sp. VCA1]
MKAKWLVSLILFVVLAVGCSHPNRFQVEGRIESVDAEKNVLHVSGFEVKVKNVEGYRVGDHIKAVLESPYADKDVYDPARTKTVSVEKGSP